MPTMSSTAEKTGSRTVAESEGNQTGMISNSDSPRTNLPPIDEAMVVISIAMAAVAP